jgi:multidrug efflux pump subunit AcrA (membrane-fusion protein)
VHSAGNGNTCAEAGANLQKTLDDSVPLRTTPPSPIGRLGGYALVAVFAFALAWASIGRVDIVAVAKGRIIPTGHSKVIQPFETGVISAIHVSDG